MVRLDHLLFEISIPQLDILSIDTEGTEIEVFESLNGLYKPTILIVEYLVFGGKDNYELVSKYFTDNGYDLVHRTLANCIFKLRK